MERAIATIERQVTPWDYRQSVAILQPLVLRWKSLTLEIARELYQAREWLRHPGARTDLTSDHLIRGWERYCKDVGLLKATANRWLERYDPEADCLLDSRPQIADDREPRLVNPQPNKYNIIYADPPWSYQNRATRAAAVNHYPCMNFDQLCALPITDMAAEDSVLLMWATFPLLRESFQVIEAWGFEYKTVAFVWVKTNENGNLFLGIGNYFRSNAEICLFGKRGQGLQPIQRPINTHLHKRMRHSQKPEIFKNLIVETFGDLPRIELFARGTSLGWTGWGYEA